MAFLDLLLVSCFSIIFTILQVFIPLSLLQRGGPYLLITFYSSQVNLLVRSLLVSSSIFFCLIFYLNYVQHIDPAASCVLGEVPLALTKQLFVAVTPDDDLLCMPLYQLVATHNCCLLSQCFILCSSSSICTFFLSTLCEFFTL